MKPALPKQFVVSPQMHANMTALATWLAAEPFIDDYFSGDDFHERACIYLSDRVPAFDGDENADEISYFVCHVSMHEGRLIAGICDSETGLDETVIPIVAG
jgi:hypothetical protein